MKKLILILFIFMSYGCTNRYGTERLTTEEILVQLKYTDKDIHNRVLFDLGLNRKERVRFWLDL